MRTLDWGWSLRGPQYLAAKKAELATSLRKLFHAHPSGGLYTKKQSPTCIRLYWSLGPGSSDREAVGSYSPKAEIEILSHLLNVLSELRRSKKCKGVKAA